MKNIKVKEIIMKNMTVFILVLLAVMGLGSGSAQAQAGQVRFDFETGDLQGWQIYSGTFGKKLVSDRPVFLNTSEPYNKQGTYHLSTLEDDGSRTSDGFTGVILCPCLNCKGPKCRF
jgi:hypothetical protein